MLDNRDRTSASILVLFLIFSVHFISRTLWNSPRALREGKVQEKKRRESESERVRERACVTEREREREKDGASSDATRSHALGSNLPIALSGIRKALQPWVEHALVFKLPMANHTSFFFCKREPSSKTARFQEF